MQALITLVITTLMLSAFGQQTENKTTTADPRVVSNILFEKSEEDPQFCEINGNVYTPYPFLTCDWFDLRQGRGPVPLDLLQPHSQCPEGTMFSTRLCTCARLNRVKCPTAPTHPPQPQESQEIIEVWCEEKGKYLKCIKRNNSIASGPKKKIRKYRSCWI